MPQAMRTPFDSVTTVIVAPAIVTKIAIFKKNKILKVWSFDLEKKNVKLITTSVQSLLFVNGVCANPTCSCKTLQSQKRSKI